MERNGAWPVRCTIDEKARKLHCVVTSQWGLTRPYSIFFSLGIVRDIVPPVIYTYSVLSTDCLFAFFFFFFPPILSFLLCPVQLWNEKMATHIPARMQYVLNLRKRSKQVNMANVTDSSKKSHQLKKEGKKENKGDVSSHRQSRFEWAIKSLATSVRSHRSLRSLAPQCSAHFACLLHSRARSLTLLTPSWDSEIYEYVFKL